MSKGSPHGKFLTVLLFLVLLDLVSLSTAQFEAFELTPSIRLISTQWSLPTVFFSCRLLRKSVGTNFFVKKVLPQSSQLYVRIGRIILSKSLSNTLRFPDVNLHRVYRSPGTLAEFFNGFFEILIICCNSSQVWI